MTWMEQGKKLRRSGRKRDSKHHGPGTRVSPMCWKLAQMATAKLGSRQESSRGLEIRSEISAGQGKGFDFIPKVMKRNWKVLNGGKHKELTLTIVWKLDSKRARVGPGRAPGPLQVRWWRLTLRRWQVGVRFAVYFEGGVTGSGSQWDASCVWMWGI